MNVREIINLIGFEIDESAMRVAESKSQAMFERMKTFGERSMLRVTAPIFGAATLAVNSFSEYNTALALTDLRLRNLGLTGRYTIAQLDQLSKTVSEGTLYGHAEVLRNVTDTLLEFKDVSASVFESAQKAVLDLASAMGEHGSLSMSSRMMASILQDPAKRLDILRRYQIFFTAAEKDSVIQMQAVGNMAGAQAKFLEILTSKVQGTANVIEKTSTGFKGFLKVLRDTGESFGKILFPIFRRFYDEASKFVRWLGNLSDGSKKLILVLGGIAAAVPVIATVLGTLGIMLPLITAGFAGLGAVAPAVLEVALALAAILVVFLAIDDVIGFLSGKKSVIGSVIDALGFWFEKLDVWAKNTAIYRGLADAIMSVVNAITAADKILKKNPISEALAKRKADLVEYHKKESEQNAALRAKEEAERPSTPVTEPSLGRNPVTGKPLLVPGGVTARYMARKLASSGATTSKSTTVNVHATIHTYVPEGTPENQKRAMREEAIKVHKELFHAETRNAVLQFGGAQ